MDNVVRVLQMLSAVTLLAAAMYIQAIFGPWLSAAMEGILGGAALLYLVIQIESGVHWQQT